MSQQPSDAAALISAATLVAGMVLGCSAPPRAPTVDGNAVPASSIVAPDTSKAPTPAPSIVPAAAANQAVSEATRQLCKALASQQEELRRRLFPGGLNESHTHGTFSGLGRCLFDEDGSATALALANNAKVANDPKCHQCVTGTRLVVLVTKEGKRYDLDPDARSYDTAKSTLRTFSIHDWRARIQLIHDYNQNGTKEILYSDEAGLNDGSGNLTIDQTLLITLDIPGAQGLRPAVEMLFNLTGASTIPIEPLAGPRLTGRAHDIDGDGVPELAYDLWRNDGKRVCGLTNGCKNLPGAFLWATYEPHAGGIPGGFDVWPTTASSRAMIQKVCNLPIGGERSPLQEAICEVQLSAGKKKPKFANERKSRCSHPTKCPYFDVLEGFLGQMGNFFPPRE